MARREPVLVNLGCGAVAHPAWVNLDLYPLSPIVKQADFLNALPFETGTVDAIYHAHVLEHLDLDYGARFLRENVRVLRPGGILRVVVPDLEEICRSYLKGLDLLDLGKSEGELLYRWASLELIDQMVRRKSGGGMLHFLDDNPAIKTSPLLNRLPADIVDYIEAKSQQRPDGRASLAARLKRGGLRAVTRKIGHGLTKLRARVLKGSALILGGSRWSAAVDEALFRATGEVHRWMYDRRSLQEAMIAAGCGTVFLKGPFESAIPDFVSYDLDTIGRRIRKPGSLFMEGIKAG